MALATLAESFRVLNQKREKNLREQGLDMISEINYGAEEPEADLTKLIVQELFQVAFVVPLPPSLLPLIKRSAISAVCDSPPKKEKH